MDDGNGPAPAAGPPPQPAWKAQKAGGIGKWWMSPFQLFVLDVCAATADASRRVVQNLADALLLEQPAAGLLQRGVMRRRGQADCFTEFRAVEEQLADAAIVLLLELLEDEAGEELWLRELFGAVDVGIVAKSFLAGRQRDDRHIPWRFAG